MYTETTHTNFVFSLEANIFMNYHQGLTVENIMGPNAIIE